MNDHTVVVYGISLFLTAVTASLQEQGKIEVIQLAPHVKVTTAHITVIHRADIVIMEKTESYLDIPALLRAGVAVIEVAGRHWFLNTYMGEYLQRTPLVIHHPDDLPEYIDQILLYCAPFPNGAPFSNGAPSAAYPSLHTDLKAEEKTTDGAKAGLG